MYTLRPKNGWGGGWNEMGRKLISNDEYTSHLNWVCVCVCVCVSYSSVFSSFSFYSSSLQFFLVCASSSHYTQCLYHVLYFFLHFSGKKNPERVCRCTLISQIMPHYTSRSTFELIHMRTNINRKTAYTQRATMQQTYARANGQTNGWMNEWMEAKSQTKNAQM